LPEQLADIENQLSISQDLIGFFAQLAVLGWQVLGFQPGERRRLLRDSPGILPSGGLTRPHRELR